MSLALDRASFRRLVQLYLALSVAAVAVAVYQAMAPAWRGFAADYDALVVRRFGAVDDRLTIATGVLLLAGFVWHVVAAGALLGLRRWARSGFWISLAATFAVTLLPGVGRPSYAGSLTLLLQTAGAALFGAIVAIAYSADHGGRWFGNAH